jgi:very-short-patch-repair endonuclease
MPKNVYRTPSALKPFAKSKRTRIHIPQPEYRPLHVRTRTVLRKELLQGEDPWWYTLHRRGLTRTKIGVDPLEARAVSHDRIKGTLPERIIYKALLQMRFQTPADFDFQSSLQGGRLELGGIVADFLFHAQKLVIQVQGPTHVEYLRSQKDREQRMTLAELGYDVFEIDEDEIYDERRMWDKLRRIFNIVQGGGTGGTWTQEEGRISKQGDDLLDDEDWAGAYGETMDIFHALQDIYPR